MANVSGEATINGVAERVVPAPRSGLVGGERPDTNKVFMTKVGLKITAELSFEDWERAGHRLSSMLDSSSWCLGDWLVYGMRNYNDRYRQAIRTVGLRYQTLRNYFWVARQFPLERRHPRLSFQHHAEVASLPPQKQDWLLDRAERLMWTTKELRSHVAAYHNVTDLSSARGTVLDVLLHGDEPAGGKMLAVTDRPRHRQLRAIMSRAFAPRVLDRVSHQVHRRTARLVREMAEVGSFDFATEVAEHIPMNTVCDLLSIPDQDRGELLKWNKLALSADTLDVDELDSQEARNEIVLYFMDLVRERRSNPGDDVVSMIATARIDDEPLTLEEVALNCYSIILGGDESSRMSAICAVQALAEHSAQWLALRDGDVRLGTAVEEILRWATPAMHFARTARHDLVIGEKQVRAGDIVTLWNISANNDEVVFAAPRTFDLSRSPNKHVAFGHGPHFCVGAFLGRTELHALLTALVDSVADLELRDTPARIYSNFLYGYGSLPVAFRPK